VERVERLGPEDVVTLSWAGLTIHAAQPPHMSAGIDGHATLRFEGAGLMLFDREGRRMAAETAAATRAAPAGFVAPARLAAAVRGEPATAGT
jgi:hypothetical protein